MGRGPYSEVLQLPAGGMFSSKDIHLFITSQWKKQLPHPMPSGKFVIIKRLTDLQIGIFNYALGEGCRNTTSEKHDELPVPTYFAVHNPHNPRVFVSPCYRVCCNSAASCSPSLYTERAGHTVLLKENSSSETLYHHH